MPGKLAEEIDSDAPYYGGACCVVAIGILTLRRHHLAALERVDADRTFQDAPPIPAQAA